MNHSKHISLNDCKPFIREPNYVRCYCVAIAATAATVVGAGVTAYSTLSKKSGTPTSGGSAAYGKPIELPDYKSNVHIPQYGPTAGTADFNAALPGLANASKVITAAGVRDRNIVMPGSSDLIGIASADLAAMGHGQVSQDVIDNTNRIIAQRAGAMFDPSAPNMYGGARVAPIADFTKEIGATSQGQVEKFLSAAPTWESLANAFAYTPDEAASTALDFLGKRYNYALGSGALQNQIDESTYNAAVNKAKAEASPDPRVVGQRNDQLLNSVLQGQQQQQQTAAIGGLTKGLTGLIGSGGSGGDIYNNAGFINSANLGAAYSSYATPGYTPTFTNTPGSGYSFSGYAG